MISWKKYQFFLFIKELKNLLLGNRTAHKTLLNITVLIEQHVLDTSGGKQLS